MESGAPADIKQRVVIALGAMIVLLMAVGAFSIFEVGRIGELTTAIHEHPLVVSNAALRARVGVVRMHRSMKDVVLLDSIEMVDEAAREVDADERATYRDLDEVRDQILGESGKHLAAEARALFTAWKPIRDEVILLMRAGDREEAARITVGRGAVHVAKLEHKMQELNTYARRKADTFQAAAVASRVRSMFITAVTVISSIMIAILAAVFFTKRILQSEARDREHHLLLNGVVEGTEDMVFVKDREKRYRLINSSGAAAIGSSPDEIIGKRARDVFSASVAEAIERIDDRVLDDNEAVSVEEAAEFLGEQRIFSSTKAPLRSADGEVIGIIGISRDVTERRQLEEQLLQSQKMEAVGTLAGGVAHEMNNVMAVVMGFGSTLVARIPQDDPSRPDLVEIVNAAKRGAALTEDLLDFARKGSGESLRCALNEIASSVTRLLHRTVPRSVRIEENLQSALSDIRAEPGALSQMLMNLCVNALDALDGAGTLEISTRDVTLTEAEASNWQGLEAGDYVRLEVKDDGGGMGDETSRRAFEPFFTTKDVGKGTGLGLSIVYNTVRRFGGSIRIDSELDRWTSVRILFPACEPSLAVAPKRDQGFSVSADSGTIMLVDDEKMILKTTARMLETLGYQTVLAGGGEEALRIFARRAADIDLVLLDLSMAGMDGVECLKRLKEMDAGVKVVICTGRATRETAAMLRANGAMNVVGKPFDIEQMSRAIREAIHA